MKREIYTSDLTSSPIFELCFWHAHVSTCTQRTCTVHLRYQRDTYVHLKIHELVICGWCDVSDKRSLPPLKWIVATDHLAVTCSDLAKPYPKTTTEVIPLLHNRSQTNTWSVPSLTRGSARCWSRQGTECIRNWPNGPNYSGMIRCGVLTFVSSSLFVASS